MSETANTPAPAVVKPTDPLTKEGLMGELVTLKTDLEKSLTDTAKEEISTQVKEAKEAFEKQIKELTDKQTVTPEDLSKIKEEMVEIARKGQVTIEAFDLLQTRIKTNPIGSEKAKSLGDAITEKMIEVGVKVDENGRMSGGEIEKALRSQGGSFVLQLPKVNLKAQGTDMTIANTLTGDAMISYNQRQVLIPGQRINFRDLIPTVQSPTGLYVTYQENAGGTNNITAQTEGATKGQNEYDLTNVQKVAKYIAGFSVFTKQMLYNLPWIQTTLTRLLLRDFYKAENSYFMTTVSGAATGTTSGGTSPNDFTQLVTLIGAQMDANYNPSVIVVSNSVMGRLISLTLTSGYYAGAGSIALGGSNGGVLTLWGVPIVSASWVPANYALILDNDYIERIEVEGLNVTFSFEDANNFRQNKVTAKVECMEEINLMSYPSANYINLGAS